MGVLPEAQTGEQSVEQSGELRLYAIAVDDVRGFFGSDPARAATLREQANTLLAPPPQAHPRRLGPLWRRTPTATVLKPTDPVPSDLDALLHGAYVRPERTGATWRLLETLVAANAWGSTRAEIVPRSLDALDLALTRAGVSSAFGIRHLLNTPIQVNLLPVRGLAVGVHRHETALAMADAYRRAQDELESEPHRALVRAFVGWLEQFTAWGPRSRELGLRPPDLVGFWVC